MNRVSVLNLVMIGSVLCSLTSFAEPEDSVPQLGRALTDLSADNSVVDLPEGLYTIGSTWVISKAGVTIRGAGLGKTILMRNPKFDGALVRMDAENSKITNLTLDGNGGATVILLDRPGVTADTIEVKNFTHIGIAVPASGCRITKCLVSGLGTVEAPSMGIWHDAGKIPTKSTITIDHSTIQNNGMCGIYCTGGEVIVTNNRIGGNHIITSPGGGQIDIGNAFTTNTVAVIKGNQILNGGGIKAGGIELGGGNFTVTDNTIRGHGLAGIGLGYNAVGAMISGNSISNSGHFIGNKGYKVEHGAGISIGYGASNIEIFGNRCFDDQPSKTQTWGIVLTGPPARLNPKFSPKFVENIVVKDNDLRENLRPEGLLDHSAARHKTISGNAPAAANR
jgi:Right handed beta helix region